MKTTIHQWSLLLLVFVLSFATFCQANEQEYSVKKNKTSLNNNSQLIIENPLYNQSVGGGSFVETHTAIAALVYGRENRSDVAGQIWTYRVDYRVVDIYNGNALRTGSISIAHSDAEGVFEQVGVHEQMGGKVRLEVTNIISTGTVPNDVRLELRMKVNRYDYLSRTTSIDLDLTAGNTSPNTIVKGQQVEAKWPFFEGAEYYELEWAYWDSENTEVPTEERIFEQAVRVETSSNYYTMDLVYPSGTVYFRVRPVGRFIVNTNGDYSHLKYGLWSDYIAGTRSLGSDFESDYNWQFTRTFAEDGKHKEVINYFDDGLKSRQTLTTLNSERTTIVAEQVYDVENRPSLSILPVPVNQANETASPLAFGASVGNQLISTGGINYNRNNFDKKPLGGFKADALPSNHISNQYYSNNNPFLNSNRSHIGHIPDAANYPISQMEYLNDATGRPKRQSGVGAFYQLESGRATQYKYSNPTTTELKRLFGSNVGDSAVHYRKNIVIDANGQQSISYVDQAGQTIATALSGASPENVQALGGSAALMVHNLMGNNITSTTNRTQEVSHQLFNDAKNKVVDFEYEFVQGQNTLFDNTCISCSYEVEFSIEDEDGNLVLLSPSSGNPSTNLMYTFDNGGNCIGSTFSGSGPILFSAELLEIGTYTIRKILTALDPNIADIEATLLQTGDLLSDTAYINAYIESNFDSTLCEPCDSAYRKELCAYYVEIVLGVERDSSSFDYKVDSVYAVVEDCESLQQAIALGEIYLKGSDCEGMLTQMEQQLSPGGCLYDNSYYQAIFDHTGTTYSYQPVFVESTNSPNNTITTYIATQQDIDMIEDPAQWQRGWENGLVVWHPEYQRYLECKETPLPESKVYDVELALFEDWQAVQAAFDPNGTLPVTPSDLQLIQLVLDQDPYFLANNTAANNLYQSMETALMDYCTTISTANPANNGMPPALNCAAIGSHTAGSIFSYIENNLNPPATATNNPNNPNALGSPSVTPPLSLKEKWELFRGIYLGEKKRIQDNNLASIQAPITSAGNYDYVGLTGSCASEIFVGTPNAPLSGGGTTSFGNMTSTANVQSAVNHALDPQTANGVCDQICAGRAITWARLICPDLANVATASTSYDAIIEALTDYCLEGCGDGTNPLGYLLQEDIDQAITPTVLTANSSPMERVKYHFAQVQTICGGIMWNSLSQSDVSVITDSVYCINTSVNNPLYAQVGPDKCAIMAGLLDDLAYY